MALHHSFGIDIGTSTVKIYDHSGGQIQKERNMIAIRDAESVFAIGNDAYDLFGKTPDNIEVYTPMANGRISDVSMMEAILHTLLERGQSRIGYSPSLYFSVPTDMTEIEKRAYHTIASRGMLRRSRIYMVERAIADAVAFDIPITNPKGTMLINFGAQSTCLSVIADGRILISTLIPTGGQSINDAIVAAVRRKNHFMISGKTAKRLKLSLADLSGSKLEARKVTGIDTRNGLPRNGVVTTFTVTSAVQSELDKITDEIMRFLQRIPPQVRTVILNEGIYLCGGSTKITGLPKYLNDRLECAVRISGYFDLHTVCGIREIISNTELQKYCLN
ncbi:MAG: rod shape-determining protein [Eubacterium sp.]|nr:rod shape-determining protein [Eubacterium sp.]